MKANKIALFILIAALLTVSVVSVTGWINKKREHERVLGRYDYAFAEACRTAVTAIQDYAKDSSDVAYARLIAEVGAMQALTSAKYYYDKDEFVNRAECNKCLVNLTEYNEDSVKHLDLLSEAFRFYLDGNIDTYTWRLSSFNASVEQERTGE